MLAKAAIFLLCCVVTNAHYDAVVWSTVPGYQLNGLTLQEAVTKASDKAPLILFAVDKFTLADFSAHTNAYTQQSETMQQSVIATSMRASNNYEVLSLADDDTVSNAPKSVTIVLVADLFQIDRKLSEFDTTLPSTRTMLITDASVVGSAKRNKRSAVLAGETATNAPTTPTVASSTASGNETREKAECALAMDGLTVSVMKGDNHYAFCLTYNSSAYDPHCPPDGMVANFTLHFIKGQLCKKGQSADVSLNSMTLKATFRTCSQPSSNEKIKRSDYWSLSTVELLHYEPKDLDLPTSTPGNEFIGLGNAYIYSKYMNSWSCSATPPVYMQLQTGGQPDPSSRIAIQFQNITVQPFGWRSSKTLNPNYVVPFVANHTSGIKASDAPGRYAEDCTPTFSTGSWMSIIIAGTMIFFMIFALCMVNSIKVPDRYDDPKQPQLIVNVKGES